MFLFIFFWLGGMFSHASNVQATCPDPMRAWVRFDASWNTIARTEWIRAFSRGCQAVLNREGDFLFVEYPAATPPMELPGLRVYPMVHVPPLPVVPWSQVGAQLVALQKAHPDIARLHMLGHSVHGRPIWAMEITDVVGNAALKPVVRITGAHHGDETVSTDIALGVISALLDPSAASLRSFFSFWVMPVVNPDGYAARTRLNGAGVDLNRDYGFFWDEEGALFSQPESRVQWKFAWHFVPFLSLDYHSAAQYVNTVYDGTSVRPPDMDVILELGEVYAGPAHLDVIVGYDWYVAYGSCQDYYYGTRGTLAYTIETLQPANTTGVVAQNVQALRDFLEHARDNAVCGTVTDSNGRPLRARIQVVGSMHPFFTSSAGVFCHIPDTDPVQWQINAPLHAQGTFVTPRSTTEPLYFSLSAVSEVFGAFSIAAMGQLGSTANTDNPTFHALGLPDGRVFYLGREGFVVLDFGVVLADVPGSELTVIFDPERQTSRVRALVSNEPWGPFSVCGEFTGDFDVDLNACAVSHARYLRLENRLPSWIAAIDGLRILPAAVDSVDADGDGIVAWQDCDDTRADVGPGFEEICDGLDNDCNGLDDEGFVVDANGVVHCESTDAGPDVTDAGPDINDDADASAGTDASKHVASGVSCTCRLGTTRAFFPSELIFFLWMLLVWRLCFLE